MEDFNITLDFTKSALIIIGAESLSSVQTVHMSGVLKDLSSIKNVFSSHIGFKNDNIFSFLNPLKKEIVLKLSQILKLRKWDSIFIYYGGIGLVNPTNNTFEIALSDEKLTPFILTGDDRTFGLLEMINDPDQIDDNNKLPINQLSSIFKNIDCPVFLFLDCGHSELAFKDFYCRDMVVIAAADIDNFTLDTPDGGVFTMNFVDIVKNGIPNMHSKISIIDIYMELKKRITSEYHFEPKILSTNLNQYLYIVSNKFGVNTQKKISNDDNPEKIKDKLRRLIIDNNYSEIFKVLLSINHGNDNDIISAASQYHYLLETRDITSYENFNINLNKIRLSILYILESLEDL